MGLRAERGDERSVRGESEDERDEGQGAVPDKGMPSVRVRALRGHDGLLRLPVRLHARAGRLRRAAAAARRAASEARTGAYLRTGSVDAWVGVGEGGLLVGRDPACDVVLHSPAVSRRHLRLVPTPDGMEVSDLGSTNPATYRGREVTERVVVPYGDSLELCGCRLTVTGPPAVRGG